MTKSALSIIYGLSIAIIMIIICILLRPAGLSANDGISYYGVFGSTIMPYGLAFLVSGFFYWKATTEFSVKHETDRRIITISLRLMTVLLVGLLLTPHTIFDPIHTAIGSVLFIVQLLLSIWFFVKLKFDWLCITFTVIELLAGIAALYYLPYANGLLLQSQVIFQIAFSLLMVRGFNELYKL